MIASYFNYETMQPHNIHAHMPTHSAFDVDKALDAAVNGANDYITLLTLQRAGSLFYQLDCNNLSAKEIADFIIGQEQQNQFT
jgi:hypothetical protein